ncbi:baseplate assembly protein [Brucella anthropi]|uniref:baseplate assembly protein n=1 Tax=Brucella anthropi TaxID=529 RepID=UPI00235E5A97|nr:baseplate assembly protein [Brucella anthropi]
MRTGIDAQTGKLLTDWPHCVQSIGKCLTTLLGTRMLRRYIGSLVPEMQDQNADPMTIFRVYMAVAEALSDPVSGEPGFGLQTIEMVEYGRSGRFVFILDGVYYPRGHLGDFSLKEHKQLSLDQHGAIV